jgi:hypothetical protein
MDRRQLIVQRARESFGDRLDDVLHMVRQDRQGLRGWEEPAHVRAVVRRTSRQAGNGGRDDQTVLAELEFARNAGEPDRGQQREGVGLLLEAGASALEKLISDQVNALSPEETLGLEMVLLLYGRPAVFVDNGRLDRLPPFWNLLEDQREDIELATRGVGRIELYGHPEYDWAGTGFLVADQILMTTRRVAEQFVENRGNAWTFRPGITAWMDYRSTQSVASAGYQVRGVIGVHERYDLALLEVEGPQLNGSAPTPLSLAAVPPTTTEGRYVYLIGYPVRDARRSEPEAIARIFRDLYNVKRVQPGQLRGAFQFNDIQLLRHDCAPLGQTSGSPILDLETHQVVGMQTSSRYLDSGTAIPLYALRDDPLLVRAGVAFAEATAQDRELAISQLERLARSRYWTEVRTTLANLYQRAFGCDANR